MTGTTVHAAVCRTFGKPLVVEAILLAEPAAGEVQVAIAACAICHSDILYADGAWGGQLPAVYGHEAAGTIVRVGAGVDELRAGDAVVVTLIRSCGDCFYCNQGERHNCEADFSLSRSQPLKAADGSPITQGLKTAAFAEQVVVHASQVVAIPKQIPFDSASLLACGVITGGGAVINTAQVKPGSSVVVVGAGGVGLNSVQAAALAGARRVIAIDTVAEKLAVAENFGATDTINANAGNVREAVHACTEGRGADYVFVTVGSIRAFQQALTLVRPGGALVIVGMTANDETLGISPLDIADSAQRILGSKMGTTQISLDVPRWAEFYRQGRLKLDELISGRYPLERINEAIASSRSGDALRNVIVFD